MGEHEKWMTIAFQEAEKAFNKDEIPVGAVIVAEGKIIGRGHNLVETLQDPTAHAEIIAITAAANSLASWRLNNTTLYTTLEPCPMCAGAIILSRVPVVVFGTNDQRMGACGSVENLLQRESFSSDVKVISGVLEQQCKEIIKAFFLKIRNKE